jgi:hypothetical protein
VEKLKISLIDPQEKCPTCSIGKSTHQDHGLAEAAIELTIMTATCGTAESCMVEKFWFKAATNGKNY